MIMSRGLAVFCAAFVLAGPAGASIETLELAVESSSKLLSVPTTSTGRVLVRSCEECELHSPRLGTNTSFQIDNERLSFEKFRQAFFNLKRGDETYVLVTYHVDSNIVLSVNVSNPTDQATASIRDTRRQTGR